MSWKVYAKLVFAILFTGLLSVVLFVFAMNPFGNLRNTVFSEHLITDDNQRYQYPSIVRSGRFDSLIVGTSTSRLLDPKAFEKVLGGRFANVGMNAATAWEQVQLVELFLRHQRSPDALVVGLDASWCASTAATHRTTFRGFPEWMYDDNPWNDLLYMFNSRTLEIAGRRLAAAITQRAPRIPADGYEIFTPPEVSYDIEKVRIGLYGGKPRGSGTDRRSRDVAWADEHSRSPFPALPWLEGLIQKANWRRIVLLFPPIHAVGIAAPSSRRGQRETECKRLAGEIASRHGIVVVDFRIASPITSVDFNFWDPMHYRVGVADRILRGIARALNSVADDPGGDWRLIWPPAQSSDLASF